MSNPFSMRPDSSAVINNVVYPHIYDNFSRAFTHEGFGKQLFGAVVERNELIPIYGGFRSRLADHIAEVNDSDEPEVALNIPATPLTSSILRSQNPAQTDPYKANWLFDQLGISDLSTELF